jgi:hypothetical protein
LEKGGGLINKIMTKEQKRQDFLDSYFEGFKKLSPTLTQETFLKYYDESQYGGYPEESGGSVWESEGKSIYVLIRILKPKKILEIGNYMGKSSNHILQAVEGNGYGEVHLLDIEERIEYNIIHNREFIRHIGDSIEFLKKPLNYDMYIHDGCHEYLHVKTELELMAKNTTINFDIWSHDYYQVIIPQCEVKRAWDDVENLYDTIYPMIDSVSDCGFLISKFNKVSNDQNSFSFEPIIN